MNREKRVWLERSLTNTDNGHYQFNGDCHRDLVAVVIDPTILARLGPDKEAELLAMHREIEVAATRKMVAGEAYQVLQDGRPWLLIALTDEDVWGYTEGAPAHRTD